MAHLLEPGRSETRAAWRAQAEKLRQVGDAREVRVERGGEPAAALVEKSVIGRLRRRRWPREVAFLRSPRRLLRAREMLFWPARRDSNFVPVAAGTLASSGVAFGVFPCSFPGPPTVGLFKGSKHCHALVGLRLRR
ncbi:MAG: hypothetical protein ABIQ33_09370 [Caldimonas sp.]